MDKPETYAYFSVVGRLTEDPRFGKSDKGNSWCRVKVEVLSGPKGYKWNYIAKGYGDISQEIGDGAREGDLIGIKGELQWERAWQRDGQTQGKYEIVLVLKQWQLVERAPVNEAVGPEAIAQAQIEADVDGIPW